MEMYGNGVSIGMETSQVEPIPEVPLLEFVVLLVAEVGVVAQEIVLHPPDLITLRQSETIATVSALPEPYRNNAVRRNRSLCVPVRVNSRIRMFS